MENAVNRRMTERPMTKSTERLHAALNTLHRYADQGEHYDSAYRKIDEAARTLRDEIEAVTALREQVERLEHESHTLIAEADTAARREAAAEARADTLQREVEALRGALQEVQRIAWGPAFSEWEGGDPHLTKGDRIDIVVRRALTEGGE